MDGKNGELAKLKEQMEEVKEPKSGTAAAWSGADDSTFGSEIAGIREEDLLEATWKAAVRFGPKRNLAKKPLTMDEISKWRHEIVKSGARSAESVKTDGDVEATNLSTNEKEENVTESTIGEPPVTEAASNQPGDKVKEGDVPPLSSEKVVHDDEPSSLVKAQNEHVSVAAVEKKEEKIDGVENVGVEDIGYDPVGLFKKEAEAQNARKNKKIEETIAGDKTADQTKVGEKIDTAFESNMHAIALWREARQAALAAEAQFQEKYEAHLKKNTEGWRYYVKTPLRKLWGLNPKFDGELYDLHLRSQNARAAHHRAADLLAKTYPKDERSAQVLARYDRLLAYHLTTNVHKERHQKAVEIFAAADADNKVARFASEVTKRLHTREVFDKLRENKWKTAAAVSIGAAAMIYAAPVLAARGALGATVGLGVRFLGKKTADLVYVGAARRNLESAQKNIGDNYLSRNFLAADQEMEKWTFLVDKREARAKTVATAVGVAAGATTAYYAGGWISDLVGGGEVVPPPPPTPKAAGNIVLPEVPRPELQGLPPDLVTLPEEAPIPSPAPRPVEFMGDMKVSEAVQPQVEDGIKDIMAGKKAAPYMSTPPRAPIPEPNPFTMDAPPVSEAPLPTPEEAPIPPPRPAPLSPEAPIPTPRPELLPPRVHVVKPYDNVWNILEGNGPDSAPVGGKSEVLKGMTPTKRIEALNKLVAYAKSDPEFAKAVGALRSGGDIGRIYPGEKINVTLLDEKLRELLGLEAPLPIDRSVAPSPYAVTPESAPLPTERPLEGALSDINKFRVADVLDLHTRAHSGDGSAVELLKTLGMDQESLDDLIASLNPETLKQDWAKKQVLEDYLKYYQGQALNDVPAPKVAPAPPSGDIYGRTPEDVPYGNYDPFARSVAPQEASFGGVDSNVLNDFVKGTEKGTGNIFFTGRPDVAGTFERIKSLSFGEMKAIASDPALLASKLKEMGVTEKGWDRWVDAINKSVKEVAPQSDQEKIGAYFIRGLGTKSA